AVANTCPRSTKCFRNWSSARTTSYRRRTIRPMREALPGRLKSWTRTASFVSKEGREVVRRPGALFSLVFGPFLIMGAFGLGYSGQYRPLNTILVLPADAGNLPQDPAYYQQFA